MAGLILALDLERTLIDNAMSCQARPGLRDFLAFCDAQFWRVLIYTTVNESDARAAVFDLAGSGHVPPSLNERLEYVDWSGAYKDLSYVTNASVPDIVLVDDDGGWIRSDQREQWIPIAGWEGGPDTELARIQVVLQGRLAILRMQTPK